MQVMELMSEGMREYSILKSESRSLKLTASTVLIKIGVGQAQSQLDQANHVPAIRVTE